MRTFAVGLAGALIVAVISSPSSPVYAQEQELCQFQRSSEQGLGGTGISSTDVLSRLTSIIPVEQGIGGSGYADDLERGLGGTGVIASNERGLGGTGIIGVVTGFASICVNGYEVHVDNQTDISVEGFAATDADLQLGQLVAVEAYTVDGALVAASVQVQVAVAGPVESVSADASTLTVAGQTLVASGFGGSADINNVVPGDWVVASGLRRADDAVAASSIVPLEGAGELIVVSGPVRETDSGAVRIGDLALTSESLSPGQEVVARGTLVNGQLTPEAVSVRPRLPFTSGVQTFSVQGFAATGVNGVPQVGGVPLAGSQPPPFAQQPVQVEGTITQGGQLIPSETFAPPPPQNGALPKAVLSPPNAGNGPGSGSGNGPSNGPGNGKGNGPDGSQSNLSPPTPNPGGGQNSSQGGSNQSSAPQLSPEVTQTGSAAQGAAPAERSTTPERSSTSNRPEQVDRPARPEQPARPERPARPGRVDRPDRPERPERVDRPERPDRPTRPR